MVPDHAGYVQQNKDDSPGAAPRPRVARTPSVVMQVLQDIKFPESDVSSFVTMCQHRLGSNAPPPARTRCVGCICMKHRTCSGYCQGFFFYDTLYDRDARPKRTSPHGTAGRTIVLFLCVFFVGSVFCRSKRDLRGGWTIQKSRLGKDTASVGFLSRERGRRFGFAPRLPFVVTRGTYVSLEE